MASLLLRNDKLTRCTKTFLNLTQFWKLYSIPNLHRNHTEEFCQPDYFEKNENNKTSPFRDLIFHFFSEPHFLCDASLAF